jgi:hypothetical protein
LNVAKSEPTAALREILKLRWLPKPCDGQVALGRTKVLANGDDLNADRGEITQGFFDFVDGFAETDHQP